ncbi:transposon Tf2-6 polyprotein [Trichonephila clavipes]|nr:transposon Tf2-6 polyprotein [Trichonephila clavipes]
MYSQRFETISIDLFGPLPESPSGKKWIFIVENCCTRWVELFALTQATARECATTLMEEFGREVRTIDDVTNDFQAIIDNENFVPEITPYLKRSAKISSEIRERIEEKQDQSERPSMIKDTFWITLHPLSNTA